MVKLISLSEEAYKILKRMKNENVSFSDIIIKISNNKENKTETFKDIIKWVEAHKTKKKKERISSKIDEIVYGVSK